MLCKCGCGNETVNGRDFYMFHNNKSIYNPNYGKKGIDSPRYLKNLSNERILEVFSNIVNEKGIDYGRCKIIEELEKRLSCSRTVFYHRFKNIDNICQLTNIKLNKVSYSDEERKRRSLKRKIENKKLKYNEKWINTKKSKEYREKLSNTLRNSEKRKVVLASVEYKQNHLNGLRNSEKHKLAIRSDERSKKISLAKTGKKYPNRLGIICYPKLKHDERLLHFIRSSYELKVCLFLKNNNIKYYYEPEHFNLGDTTYTPDIKISDNIYIEVKGPLFDKQHQKMKDFVKKYNKRLIVVANVCLKERLKDFEFVDYMSDLSELLLLIKETK